MADIKKKLDKYIDETFEYEKLEDVIGDRFGRYSKYIIQDRAIPDVRDGLKERLWVSITHMETLQFMMRWFTFLKIGKWVLP